MIVDLLTDKRVTRLIVERDASGLFGFKVIFRGLFWHGVNFASLGAAYRAASDALLAHEIYECH